MKENLKFLIQICGATTTLLLVAMILVNFLGNPEYLPGIFYGYLVSLANILFAFYSIKWAFDKPNNTFFTVILGGMGARFILLLSVLLFVKKFTQIPFMPFVISLVGFYLTLQAFEIMFIQKYLNNRKALS